MRKSVGASTLVMVKWEARRVTCAVRICFDDDEQDVVNASCKTVEA